MIKHYLKMSALTGGSFGGEGDPPPSDPPPGDPPPSDPPPSDPPPSDNWRDSLSDELKGEASLEKYASIEDLAKGYVHASKAIGADKAIIFK